MTRFSNPRRSAAAKLIEWAARPPRLIVEGLYRAGRPGGALHAFLFLAGCDTDRLGPAPAEVVRERTRV